MPRLSDAEREARRKARVAFSFSDAAYDHYNPEKEGYGSPDQWEEIARKMFGLKKFAKASRSSPNKYLAALYLEIMPVTFEALKDAFRKAMFKSHPDYGGSNEAARDTLEAFAILKRRFV